MNNRFVVIMAGGRGERFWPQSRLTRPKHLLPIVGDSAMLAQTVERLDGLVPIENIFVITNVEQRDAVLESCPGLLPDRVIGEPVGRDTAAAVGLAALLVDDKEKDAAFALLPADHVIEDGAGFRSVLTSSFEAAEKDDFLVTIGIKPTFPSTGYGYLCRGAEMEKASGRLVSKVDRFVEKPDLETAGNTWQRVVIFGMLGCLYGDHQLFYLLFPGMHPGCLQAWMIYGLTGVKMDLWMELCKKFTLNWKRFQLISPLWKKRTGWSC
jgi:mannose-1-phosphate guanylyltransferase